MTVYIIFSTIGTDAGPFNLYSDVDGYTSAFAIGITRAQLLAGFPSTVLAGTTIVRAKSTGVCINSLDMPVVLAPITTTTSTTGVPTTTTTTTVLISDELSLHLGVCADVFFPDFTYYVLQAIPNISLVSGDVVYNEPGFITVVDGLGLTYTGFFNGIKYQFAISSSGIISSIIVC